MSTKYANAYRETPLMLAAEQGNVSMMQYLLDMGAQPSEDVLEYYQQYRTDEYRNPKGQYDEGFEKKLIGLISN